MYIYLFIYLYSVRHVPPHPTVQSFTGVTPRSGRVSALSVITSATGRRLCIHQGTARQDEGLCGHIRKQIEVSCSSYMFSAIGFIYGIINNKAP